MLSARLKSLIIVLSSGSLRISVMISFMMLSGISSNMLLPGSSSELGTTGVSFRFVSACDWPVAPDGNA